MKNYVEMLPVDIEVGDVVRVRGQTTKMTVAEPVLDENAPCECCGGPTIGGFRCIWFDKGDKLHEAFFVPDMLEVEVEIGEETACIDSYVSPADVVAAMLAELIRNRG